jgi:hypothetical protein
MVDGGRAAGVHAIGRGAVDLSCGIGSWGHEGSGKDYQCRARKKEGDRLAHAIWPFKIGMYQSQPEFGSRRGLWPALPEFNKAFC